MKKTIIQFSCTLLVLSMLSITGCGGSEETSIVEPYSAEMLAEQEAKQEAKSEAYAESYAKDPSRQ